MFYSFLESARGGGVQEIQGFPDLAPFYQPNAIDRGISNLDLGNGLAEWKRAVTMLGDAITNADKARPVVAAVVATTSSWLPLLDQIRGLAQSPSGPTLDEFLQPFGIQWSDVRGRYGQTALDWHPFGGNETIVDLLEELRVQTNSRLDPRYWFRWDYMDLTEATRAGRVQRLQVEPSVVFVDPVSLYVPVNANALRGLDDYVRQEHSIMVSLSPVPQAGVDWFASALRFQSAPLLNDYFEPKIPPLTRQFAKCAFNVQRIADIERLIRSRIALMDLAAKEAEARNTTGVGRK